VRYVNLSPTDEDLTRIEDMGVKLGYLKKRVPMNELIDRSFEPKEIIPAAIDVNRIVGKE
jgi:hypothetical protein